MRPNWDGSPVSAWSEMIALSSSLPAIILFVASAFVIRFRHQLGALITVVLWTLLATFLTMLDPTGLREPAIAEGCVGSPTIFLTVIGILSVIMIVVTNPKSE